MDGWMLKGESFTPSNKSVLLRLRRISLRVDDFVDGDRTILPSKTQRSNFYLSFSLSFFFCNLILLSPRLAIPPIFFPSQNSLLPHTLPPHPLPLLLFSSLCTLTDPSGNCFESARHFCVVAVYLCWGHRGPEPQFLSTLGLEVKLPNSFTDLCQKTLILDQRGFTV